MSLSQKISQKIDSGLQSLIEATEAYQEGFKAPTAHMGYPGFETTFYGLRSQALAILAYLPKTEFTEKLAAQINRLRYDDHPTSEFLGCIKGLREAHNQGFLENAIVHIEANIVSDYMGQAEQLLGEGVPGQFDHVPAAVMAGAVLEDAARRLCLRHDPSFNLFKPNGDPKALNTLITDLQGFGIITKARADILRGYAKIRNSAAHGKFSEFTKEEVKLMIDGIKIFLADNL